MLQIVEGITVLPPAIHADLLKHDPRRRSYYLDIKVNGKFAMHDTATRYTMLAKVHDNAQWMSIGIGKAGIVIVHSCRFEFNDVIGFWYDGRYFAKAHFGTRGTRLLYADALYQQHMHGTTS